MYGLYIVSFELRCNMHFRKKSRTYPSAFLQRHANKMLGTVATQSSKKGKGKMYTYERDIVCLPKQFAKQEDLIGIPRKKDVRHFLAVNKLVGKIQLRSDMEETDIFDEIWSVFRVPMDHDDEFQFTILQPSGGDSRSLMVPELSHSYQWTSGAIAGRNAKTPIYILAEDQLKVCLYMC